MHVLPTLKKKKRVRERWLIVGNKTTFVLNKNKLVNLRDEYSYEYKSILKSNLL